MGCNVINVSLVRWITVFCVGSFLGYEIRSFLLLRLCFWDRLEFCGDFVTKKAVLDLKK